MAPPPDDPTPALDDAPLESDGDIPRSQLLENVLSLRLTPRQRTVRAVALVGTVLLALVLLVTLVPDVRLGVQRALIAPTAAPTLALAVGDDAFWFTPLAPGETLQLDGHVLTNPPLPGDAHPLRLSRGIHQVEWEADPFQPQNCLLSVPLSPSDTCPTTAAFEPSAMPAGRIFDDSESLATLSDPLRLSLIVAINETFAATYTASVQPGEYYRPLDANAISPLLKRAQQPLFASLRFAQEPGWTEPCAISPIATCRAQGQDCEQLCTLLPPAIVVAGSAVRAGLDGWYVGLTAGLVWTYATGDGHVIEQGAPDVSFNFTLVVMRVSWDGTNWTVAPVLGTIPGLVAARDVTCSALTYDLNTWVDQNAAEPFVDVRTEVRYASDGDPTDGCAGVVTATRIGNDDTPTPVTGAAPLLLHRFGVLLAANGTAHALWPLMPVADPAEATLAARMATT